MENSKSFQRMDLALDLVYAFLRKYFVHYFRLSIDIHERKKKKKKRRKAEKFSTQRNGLGSLLANRKFVSSVFHTEAYNIQLFVWQVCLYI